MRGEEGESTAITLWHTCGSQCWHCLSCATSIRALLWGSCSGCAFLGACGLSLKQPLCSDRLLPDKAILQPAASTRLD